MRGAREGLAVLLALPAGLCLLAGLVMLLPSLLAILAASCFVALAKAALG